MKSPLYNHKNRFIFSNIWKTAAVEALWVFFQPRLLGAYWTVVALNECFRSAPALSVFTLIHLPVGVLLLWLLMTLFPASNDFSKPLMKGLGISAQKHSVPFVLSLKKHKTKHAHARPVLGSNHYFIPLTYIPFSCSPQTFASCPSPPHHRLHVVTRAAGGAGTLRATWTRDWFFFFLLPFFVSKERPTPPEAASSKYRTQRQEQGGILFSDFITPRMLGVYSNSLSTDMHGEGCDYAPLSRSALI